MFVYSRLTPCRSPLHVQAVFPGGWRPGVHRAVFEHAPAGDRSVDSDGGWEWWGHARQERPLVYPKPAGRARPVQHVPGEVLQQRQALQECHPVCESVLSGLVGGTIELEENLFKLFL